jgi:prophage regulatory protein
MTRKLVSKKELKTVYGIPYCFAHIARLEADGLFPTRVRVGASEWRGTRMRSRNG